MTIDDDDVRLSPGEDEPCFRPNPAHARKEIPEEVLADAQNLYVTTDLPLIEIARRVGLHRSLLYRTVQRKGWERPDPKAMRATVAKRVRARIEKELAAVELSLTQIKSEEARAAARDSAAILASLTRSLRELQSYDLTEAKSGAPRAGETPPAEDDPAADLDGFRQELARRLERLATGKREEDREAEAATAMGGGGI